MSEMKSLGKLGEDVIEKLKKAKLMTIIRGAEVWVDEEDLAKARKLMEQEASAPAKPKSKENPYKFHGYIIRTPEALKLNQSYIASSADKTGRQGNHSILEFAKPFDGLDVGTARKQIASVAINGEKIELNASAFVPGYSGIVMNDDNGIPLFEITPYNIFVLFDTRINPIGTCKIYEKLLIFCVMLSESDDPKAKEYFDKIWARQAPIREKYEIKQFMDMFMGGIKQEIESLKKTMEKEERNIKTYEQEIFKSVRYVAESEVKLIALSENGEKTVEKRATEEWEKVKAFERTGAVSNVRITPSTLAFRTRMISWTPKRSTAYVVGGAEYTAKPDDPIEFGEYEVVVQMGSAFSTTIKNMTKTLDYQGNRWHHPHIKEGHLCMGNMTETIPKFTARREFEAIMVCFLRWLETVATADAYGQYVGYWIKDHQERADERKKRKEAKEKAEAEAKAKAEAAAATAAKALVDVSAKEKKEEPVTVESKRAVKFVLE